MKGRKSLIAKTLGIVLVIFAFVLNAIHLNAYESFDTTLPVSLEIEYLPEGSTFDDIEFSLYKVADVDANLNFTWIGDFKKYEKVIALSTLDQEGWRNLGLTLKGYVNDDQLVATATKHTASGIVKFDQLQQGLYLVDGRMHYANDKVYYIQPSMVCLPSFDEEGKPLYDVKINPKYSTDEVEKVRLVKIWEYTDPNDEVEVTVHLHRDGELYDIITLNHDNNWQHEIINLEKGHEWTVAEQFDETAQWTIRVDRNMHIFEIRNSYIPETPEEPTPTPEVPTETPNPTPTPTPSIPNTPPSNTTPPRPTIPNTGLVWWPVPVLLGGGFLLIVIGLFLKRRENENS
ncbi:MAG: hypothetical protein IJ875_05120 [Solobacterium sp.]|nr:hypothetical protein [Solobacterium sp.]